MSASSAATAEVGRLRPTWIYGLGIDVAVALCWVPIWVLWHVLTSGSDSDGALKEGVRLALLASFLHQPLTFGLVYGDARQFALHRRLFVIAPLVAGAAAVVAASLHLWFVVPIAALWNTQHTLQQRYGLQRIYARKSGYGSARLDRAFAYLPMVAALLAIAAAPGTADVVDRSGLGSVNGQGVRLLLDLRPVAVGLCAAATLATLWVVVALLRQEVAAGEKANPAKWLYQLASLALVASIVVDPAAGFIAYVFAHAFEYFVIVLRTAETRYGRELDRSSFLGRTAHTVVGRVAVFGAIAVSAWAVQTYTHGSVFAAVLYTVGALHFTYDAVIWKLRKPAVASSFAIKQPAVATSQ